MKKEEPQTFMWRGSEFRWKHESWPSFNNSHEAKHDFYGQVQPVGTAWRAELRAGDLKHFGPVTDGPPQAALEACRVALIESVRKAFGNQVERKR